MAESSSPLTIYDRLSIHLESSEHFGLINELLNQLRENGLISKERPGEQAARWLAWARSRQHLRVTTGDVPTGILPDGLLGTLHDIRVHTKWGPDDPIYDANKDIRDKVARGNCFLELSPAIGHCGPPGDIAEPSLQCVTYALKKFTGGLGDDDDREQGDNHTWKRYFVKPLDDARTVVATQKANGEAAHLSACSIAGHYLICAGSKNVHMLLRNRGDIESYSDQRFRVAREVAEAVFDVLDAMTDDNRLNLLEFLSTSSYTGIFEILNPGHQHVEDLSHLKRAELRFITWTSGDLEPEADAPLSAWPPHVSIEVARSLGLPTVDYDIIAVSQVDDRMTTVRQGYGYEGEVLYFLDASQAVIGLLKKKTIWYILCRAIREKVRMACQQHLKSGTTFSLSVASHKIEKRVEEIQKWLGLDEETTQSWKRLGCRFLKWTIHHIDSGKLGFPEVADMFPVTWKRYLEDTGQTDVVSAKWTEPSGSDD